MAEARVTAVIEAKDQASRVLSDISGNFSIFNGKLLGIAGAIGIAGGAMIKVSNDTKEFNKWIIRAGTNVDATEKQMDEFREIAIKATKDTAFSAEQAAAALFQIAGGSIDAEDSMQALADTVRFATATGLEDLDDAAITVANVMTLFKLRGEDAARAMDVLTVAGQSAFGTTQDIVAAFKEAGPIASQLGISIEDLSSLIIGLAEAGTTGTEAGVALKRAFTELISPSSQTEDALEAIGISVDEVARLMPEPIKLLGLFERALEDVEDPIRRAAILSDIFGQISGPAMAALLGQGTESLEGYQVAMDGAAGATDKAALANAAAVTPVEKLSNLFFEFEAAIMPAVNAILEELIPLIQILANLIGGTFNAAVQFMSDVFFSIIEAGMLLSDTVFPAITSALEPVIAFFDRAANVVNNFVNAIREAISLAGRAVSNVGSAVGGVVRSIIPSFDQGGVVPGPVGAPMLAMVHGGERVVPVGGSGGGITVNITGNTISSALDIRNLADQVGREVMRSLKMAQQI